MLDNISKCKVCTAVKCLNNALNLSCTHSCHTPQVSKECVMTEQLEEHYYPCTGPRLGHTYTPADHIGEANEMVAQKVSKEKCKSCGRKGDEMYAKCVAGICEEATPADKEKLPCLDEKGECKNESCEDCKKDGFHGLGCPSRDIPTPSDKGCEHIFYQKCANCGLSYTPSDTQGWEETKEAMRGFLKFPDEETANNWAKFTHSLLAAKKEEWELDAKRKGFEIGRKLGATEALASQRKELKERIEKMKKENETLETHPETWYHGREREIAAYNQALQDILASLEGDK